MAKDKELKLKELVKKARSKGFYEGNTQRKVQWSIYTANQINDVLNTINFINAEVEAVPWIEPEGGVGRPATHPKKLAKAILFIELMGIPERKAQGWITLLKSHLNIEENLDDRVIGKAYNNDAVFSILQSIFKKNSSGNGVFCGDGSGLEQSRKENYESTKKKGLYMTTIVDSRQIVQEFSLESKQECQLMHDLVKNLKERLQDNPQIQQKLTLDAGFIDRKLTELISQSGMKPFIFPKKNLTFKAKGSFAWKKMLNSFINDVQSWLKEYHIRSNVESFFSSLKRIFGIVTKRKPRSIYVQVLCRAIHNNRRKLQYHDSIGNG
ncbi:MAG: transposase [bacterium]